MLRNIVIKNRYLDSVMLMSVAAKAREGEGINEISAMMGSDANKEILANSGLLDDTGKAAAPMDLLIAIDADNETAMDAAVENINTLLTRRGKKGGSVEETVPRSLDEALDEVPEARLLFISLPGAYARREAEAALNKGLHVMIFSDNVSLEDEIALKQKAREKGLIVMGPDCGTAIINGVALGFANVLNRGGIGIVGASGTGIQEVSSLISNLGEGISQAIGTGGRDLKEEVGGISMLSGLEALAHDDETKVIVLVSKPPAPVVARAVLDRAQKCGKPVIVNFLKGDADEAEKRGLPFSPTLEEAAMKAVATLRGEVYTPGELSPVLLDNMRKVKAKLVPDQKYIRGLFSGGTLTDEALLIFQKASMECYSNTPLKSEYQIENASVSREHTLVDLGDDEFTRGRPHPMIDFTLRCERIVQEAKDPETAVILLDVVLGYGSHPDPAAELVPVIEEARALAINEGRHLVFVASVTGTDADPQNRARQVSALEKAGVLVADSNAQASRLAERVITQ